VSPAGGPAIDERFQHVGPAADFPENEFRIFRIEGRDVGVVMTKAGFFAVNNVCPHQGAALCEGRVGGTMTASSPREYSYSTDVLVATCPWHRWEFELGTGRSYGGTTHRRLMTFEVLVRDGEVYVAVRRRKVRP
jgi:nitrite reductase/ring-hydroxylating ferredoxin subunit